MHKPRSQHVAAGTLSPLWAGNLMHPQSEHRANTGNPSSTTAKPTPKLPWLPEARLLKSWRSSALHPATRSDGEGQHCGAGEAQRSALRAMPGHLSTGASPPPRAGSQADYPSYAARRSANSPAEITQLVCYKKKKKKQLGCRQAAFVQALACLRKVSEHISLR